MTRVTVQAAGPHADAPTPVLLDVDDDSTVADLAVAIGSALGIRAEGLWLEGAELAASTLLGETRIADGSAVAVRAEDSWASSTLLTRGWQLRVVAGACAGRTWELPIGEHTLGRAGAYAISGDPRVSRAHATIVVTDSGACVLDLGSSNGTYVDGQPVEGSAAVAVEPGAVIRVGDTMLTIAHALAADAAVHPGPGGTVEVTRPPRIRPAPAARKIVFPALPEKQKKRRIPWIAMLLPLAMGIVMAILMSPMYIAFALMSPVMMLGNVWMERREAKGDARIAAVEYDERVATASADLEKALRAETALRRTTAPDAARALLMATLPTRELWHRRRIDGDAYDVRIGTADIDSNTTVETERSGEIPQRRTLFSVPVVLSLRAHGVIGIAGPSDRVHGLAAWVVVQLSVCHAPRDLTLVGLLRKDSADLGFLRWMPHARPAGDGPAAFVGNDKETMQARISELSDMLKQRKAARVANSGLDKSSFPAVVVVLDGARELRSMTGLAQLLTDGPEVAMFFVCLEEEDRLLPEECTATVVIDDEIPTRCTVHQDGDEAREDVVVEAIEPLHAERICLGLAPLVDVNPEESELALPDSARLLDVVSLDPPTVDGIRARWQLDGQTTRMPIGAGTDGAFTLDLRLDGPHGLIAGTTGSGKSELLQTMIASLAIGNRPDAMNFVLVDYKGGSAFKDCVRLPHTVGMVTDLDTRLVGRALISLGAELKRREHMLADASVKDIEDYQDLAARTPGGLAPLPRLLIVIDEFASLARELPDFVTGLVNIAQRGRSLGIHLILATQRPTGVVSPEIRANTNMRLSLRVTDASESSDVLDAPDASRITKSTPGRGYARLGAGALVPFQAGRVGGRRPGVKATHVRPPFVARVAWGDLGYGLPQPPAGPKVEEDVVTDLADLVDVVSGAAEQEGQAIQRSPWLPALPEKLLYDELSVPRADPTRVVLAFGREDVPEDQVQRVRGWDLGAEGHMLVMGASRSGRSQLLRTIGAAVAAYDVDDVHVYGLDFGNGALQALEALPHCGAVVGRSQTERALRLLARLGQEMEQRQAVLSAGGHADIVEQRRHASAGERLPHLVVLLDRWEGFLATVGEIDGGTQVDAILAMLREGGSLGIHLAIVGDRSVGSGRISSLTENKFVLRVPDKGDAGYFGLRERDLPDAQAAGRLISAATTTETQVALLAADESAPAQADALRLLAEQARARGTGSVRPFRVDVLPTTLTVEEALAFPRAGAPGLAVPAGVGGDDLALHGFAVHPGSAVLVAGPARSGRSTLLQFMAEGVLAQGAEVAVIAPRTSPLRALADRPGVRAVISDAQAPEADWEKALAVPSGAPLVVIIDDGEAIKDCPANALFEAILRGERGDTSLVLGGHLDSVAGGFSGWQVEAKKARRGVLIAPQGVMDGELIGARLPRNVVGAPATPGRGLLHGGDGALVTLSLPLTREI